MSKGGAARREVLLYMGAIGLVAGLLIGGLALDGRDPAPSSGGEARASGQATPTGPPRGEQNLPPELQQADPAAPPPPTVPVRCDLPPPGEGAPRTLSWRAIVLDDPPLDKQELARRLQGRRVTAAWDGSTWIVQLPEHADALVFEDEDGDRTTLVIRWDEGGGRCLLTPDHLRTVEVAGRVQGVGPDDRVEVFVCGDWVEVDEQGRFEAKAPPEPLCLAYASRKDGMLSALGTIVELDLSAGGQLLDLSLDLPDFEVAGIGVAFIAVEDGVEVMEPVPGGPAEAAGLAAGELVTHVDGEAVAGWDLADVVQAITGPVGTGVELTVQDEEGRVRTVELTRAPIPDPEPP